VPKEAILRQRRPSFSILVLVEIGYRDIGALASEQHGDNRPR
jgi:hypothetical protein